ncbi:hypothetical protein [Belnapia moabensis]|uniref:hypothetical protein n=1 Tax=Belnapia moabensis TaxID=365533 RepID=UPI0005BC8B38|nr:hypothetical protein [Belnapia moabensis]
MSDVPTITGTRQASRSAANGRRAASDAGSSGASPIAYQGTSEAAQIADNIIRQQLRVGNPYDPVEIVNGLRRLFPEEARLLDAESEGYAPSMAISTTPAIRPAASMATDIELDRVEIGIAHDLRALSTDHRLGDFTDEFAGIRQSVMRTLADGHSAAALALDPRNRDRLFGARRQLGEYGRLFRMIGALNPAIRSNYRRLALNLDDAGALLLVLAGETLAAQNLGGVRFLPSVAASELQIRRDNVLNGLRAIFSLSSTISSDSFPWSMDGMRAFMQRIENSGHLDLRALLDEGTMASHLDPLVELATRNDGPGLRQLSAVADITTQKLYRLLSMGSNPGVPQAPALSHFLKALQIFLDTFKSSKAGYRLPYVGRPLIAQRGMQGAGAIDTATTTLMALVGQRATLAGYTDCFLECQCDEGSVINQIMLDKILYDVDRAVDLYIQGMDATGMGEAEWRAAAYGRLIERFLDLNPVPNAPFPNSLGIPPAPNKLRKLLEDIKGDLLEGKFQNGPPIPPPAMVSAMIDELCLQRLTDVRLKAIVQTMSAGCVPIDSVFGALEVMVSIPVGELQRAIGAGRIVSCPEPDPKLPLQYAVSLGQITQSVHQIQQSGFP